MGYEEAGKGSHERALRFLNTGLMIIWRDNVKTLHNNCLCGILSPTLSKYPLYLSKKTWSNILTSVEEKWAKRYSELEKQKCYENKSSSKLWVRKFLGSEAKRPYCETNQLQGLWKPEVQCLIQKGPPIIPILSRVNPIPRIDTYSFKIHFNIVLPSMPRPS